MTERATLVTGISELVTNSIAAQGCAPSVDRTEARLGRILDAAVVVRTPVQGPAEVVWTGTAASAPQADERVDLGGRCVVPAFVDAHTHLAFAGDRADEFTARMAGRRYDGGGIARTVSATRAAPDDLLRRLLTGRIEECRRQGTGVVEIKTGYSLDLAGEARLARIAGEFTSHVTFLGAHVVPAEFASDRMAYLDLVTGPILEEVCPTAGERLVDAIDVFCEPNSPHAFTGEEARQVLTAGAARGLLLRVHANQLGPGPGVRLACELGAADVDHCTFLDAADIDALAGAAGTTVATLLPGVEFSTRAPYADARRLLDAGADVALATDCNPGTCYSSSMPWVIALAVRELGMTPAEALWCATAGAARAVHCDAGRIERGGPALLTVLDAPAYTHLAYRPGVPIARLLELDRPSR